jgi:23S rRNA (guanosine2251-2'-O)-methyltransferase
MAHYSAHKGERAKKEKKVYIYGKHALIEALTECPYIVEKVFLAPHVEEEKLFFLLKKNNATVVEMSARDMEDEVGEDTTHQGIIALVNPEKMMRPLDSFLEGLDMSTHPAVVIFDEVHDPQNVGAVIRSAAAFGISGILMPEHNQAQVTGAVVKVSAGWRL